MEVFVLEGGGASASESDADVFEDEGSGAGLRFDFSNASLLNVRRSLGRGDEIASSCGTAVSSAAPCCPRCVLSSLSSSRDIVSSLWDLRPPCILYPSAYQDL